MSASRRRPRCSCSTTTNHDRFDDFRPAVHDSDGLLVVNGAGEHLWRKLANPKTLQVSSFVDQNPRGFGLMQRKRDAGRLRRSRSHLPHPPLHVGRAAGRVGRRAPSRWSRSRPIGRSTTTSSPYWRPRTAAWTPVASRRSRRTATTTASPWGDEPEIARSKSRRDRERPISGGQPFDGARGRSPRRHRVRRRTTSSCPTSTKMNVPRLGRRAAVPRTIARAEACAATSIHERREARLHLLPRRPAVDRTARAAAARKAARPPRSGSTGGRPDPGSPSDRHERHRRRVRHADRHAPRAPACDGAAGFRPPVPRSAPPLRNEDRQAP